MKMKVATTLFNFTFAFLYQLVDKALMLFDRDSAELAQYGIDAAFKADLSAKNTALKSAPDDIVYKSQVSIASADRDKTAEEVKATIRNIVSRAIDLYGEESGQYRMFGIKNMDSMDVNQLFVCATRVVEVGGSLLTELSAKGLTQQMLDDLETAAGKLDTKIDTKTDSVMDRDEATEKRILDANVVYGMVVSMFRYGKVYWADKSEAKYNDYVIYNTPDGLPPPAEQFGMVHGTVLNADTLAPVPYALVFFEGIEEPVEADEDGTYERDQIPLTSLLISATADGMVDFESPLALQAGQDVLFDIMMQPNTTPPPPNT